MLFVPKIGLLLAPPLHLFVQDFLKTGFGRFPPEAKNGRVLGFYLEILSLFGSRPGLSPTKLVHGAIAS